MESKERARREAARRAIIVVEVWTVVLAMGISVVGVGCAFLFRPLAPLIGVVILLHWLLLARVLERRRWACALSSWLSLIYLFPPSAWRWPGLESIGTAALLALLMASVAAGWPEMKSGW